MKVHKRKKSWAENYKVVFFEIGIIFALSLCLMAFNWKSYESLTVGVLTSQPTDFIDIVELKTIVEPPKLPEIPKPNITMLKVVDDNNEPEIDPVVIFEPKYDTVIWTPPPTLVIETEEQIEDPLDYVEKMPEFPGGEVALFRFLGKNMVYPSDCRNASISGTVHVKFVIEKNGSISGIQIMRSPHDKLSQEAIRVLNKMPNWNPGMKAGKLVRVNFHLPVKFILK
ncbi:MAG: energy transducer TonB [Bacteroidales bacterium]|nr:energy transducer TonB [Bacteroidales bacterium]